MPLVKNHIRFGKKQTVTSTARSASVRKPATGKKTKSAGKPLAKPATKRSRSSAKFSSLKSRQMTVESAKRSVWAALHDITKSLIRAASTGNLATAKELFNFAGVYSLPEDECAVAAAAPVAPQETVAPAAEPAMVHPIDLFFKKLGVEPSTADPEPEAA